MQRSWGQGNCRRSAGSHTNDACTCEATVDGTGQATYRGKGDTRLIWAATRWEACAAAHKKVAVRMVAALASHFVAATEVQQR